MRNELAGAFLCDTIVPMLNEWYRASELTADRAGYLCSKDMEAIAILAWPTTTLHNTSSYIATTPPQPHA